jgi:PhoH-like ATPase
MENLELALLDEKEYSKKLRTGDHSRDSVFGISPGDMEQYLAMQYGLLNMDISTFILSGGQGCGKTLLTYVCAIDQVGVYLDAHTRQSRNLGEELGKFKQVVIFTPIEIVGGKEIGYLPGNVADKLRPHLDKYADQHNVTDLAMVPWEQMLRHPRFDTEFGLKRTCEKIGQEIYLPDSNAAVTVVHTGFLRGRSFSKVFAWIDEAQNLTPYEVKTIIQRLGEGCKIIITGDPNQTDNPLCSREINGLTHAINFFLKKPYSAQVNLTRNYRSQMSKDVEDWHVYSR